MSQLLLAGGAATVTIGLTAMAAAVTALVTEMTAVKILKL
jgi:hypothetical protein